MKKNISAVLIALSVLAMLGCSDGKKESPGWDVVISGKVGFPQEGNITIKSWSDTTDGFQVIDFDRANYTYRSAVRVTEPGYWRINFFDNQIVDVALYKGDLVVNADGNNPNGFFEVVGSPDVKLFESIRDIRQKFNSSPELASLWEDFNKAAKEKDEKLIAALQAEYMKMLNDSISKLLIRNTPSVGVIEFLSNRELDPDLYFETYSKVAEIIRAGEWATYQIGKDFIEMVDKMKAVAIGVAAPEIALPDPTGKIVTLSSLRGKYVLVDFWAKWCGPCRQENPNVVRVYNKYKDRGFEVFGVSLDRSKEDWLQAIAEDGLAWTHVSDLKYFNSEAARAYNINAIPFPILLNPEGKIIAKNLRGKALEAKLEQVFDGKE